MKLRMNRFVVHNAFVFNLLLCAALLTGLSGCSWFMGGEPNYVGTTLSDLEPARMPNMDIEVPKVELSEIEESYRRALDVAENDEVRRKILVRLAGLQMMRSEESQLAATEAEAHFDSAIDMYRELIDLQEGRPGRDKLMYQLSKAYALDGRTEESVAMLNQLAQEYPNSEYIAEAQFRRAERAFSDGDYIAAEQYYSSVTQQDPNNAYFDNALYMEGWAQFKRSRYEEALQSFTEVMDRLMQGRETLEELETPQQNLANDTLRVMSLVFTYLDGPATIRETYAEIGLRSYNHLLYQRLGDLYLEKRRFRDSADTFASFVESEPFSNYAPDFSVRIINVYDEGDFPSELLPAKEDFIVQYGIRSAYWAQKPEDVREKLKPYLHQYLEELAKYEHSLAQSFKNPSDTDLSEKDLAKMQEQASEKYAKAARWYEEFIETFPNDEDTPNMVFLLGESYYESDQLGLAVIAYEKVAYEYFDEKQGPEAGYSAILALQQLVERTANVPEEHQIWRDHLTLSSINFSDYYPNDERAPKVLAQATQHLLEKGESEKAVVAAQRLTQWQPALDPEIMYTAWLVIGQGQFDLQNYSESELAYRQVLVMMDARPQNAAPLPGPTRQQVVDRIAANMYKMGEQMLAQENKAGAAQQFLLVSQFAPGTDIAISAQYDAATYYMEMENWSAAEREMVAFRNAYPNHPLTNTLSAKLVVIYQAMNQYGAAASELDTLAASDADPEVRRQSLYMSAELYEQSGSMNNAITAYRDYANTYEDPFDVAVEARNKLVELYGKTGDMEKRNYWLQKLIATDAAAGALRTDRSRTLAAMATAEFADQTYREFESIKLTLPLKRSLDRKKKALEQSLAEYEKLLQYGVAEYSTLASYRIGNIYAQLSTDLMNSQRPDNLDELALEQYDILLEEQAFPFEEKAIEIHEANARRSWEGIYDKNVKESFQTLGRLLPARYNKHEDIKSISNEIF